jgi:hypothetical protein
MRYDASEDPLASWFGLDESEQADLVELYHSELTEPHPAMPNPRLHALFHAAVERQLMDEEALPVRHAFTRLLREGLSRHDAIHAIGQVLAEQVWQLVNDDSSTDDPNLAYFAALERLTADGWLNQPQPAARRARHSKHRRR